MATNSTSELLEMFRQFREFASGQLPEIEKEVNAIIKRKEKDSKVIEYMFDVLLSLMGMGAGKPLFIRLQDYYRAINPKGSADYQQILAEMYG